jgi:hypothetical protein
MTTTPKTLCVRRAKETVPVLQEDILKIVKLWLYYLV